MSFLGKRNCVPPSLSSGKSSLTEDKSLQYPALMLHVVASTAVPCEMRSRTRSQPPPPGKSMLPPLVISTPSLEAPGFFLCPTSHCSCLSEVLLTSQQKLPAVLTVFSFFPLLMLPFKETNSSEESECDDLDPNTSMEVEAAIVVLFPIMIVFLNVFYNSDLAEVTSQSRINCDLGAYLGVPSQLKNKKEN